VSQLQPLRALRKMREEPQTTRVYDEGRYVTVNECACAILGCSREELLTRDVGDFSDGAIDRRVLLKNEHREGVRIAARTDGSKVPGGICRHTDASGEPSLLRRGLVGDQPRRSAG
jgi:PAS domain-containing protein